MSGRGLGSTVAPRVRTRGSGLEPRLEGLDAAVEAARGRLDDDLLDSIEASVARSTGRLQMSVAHTIVAIAGSTGSGKSTLFNALAGVELSASGAQRPTTSTAKALVWTDDDVEDMITWLGVPARDQHRRASLSPAPSRSRLPEGVLLLDLPDHDSLEVAHHREAERIVELADLLIWVVDPQKYADAAIHRRFLQPLAGHRAVTMVVLNHIDTVPEERRVGMLRDLRRLVIADGIRDPRVLATSARHGVGMKELRGAIRTRVEEKQHATLRVEADIRAAATRAKDASGDAPLTLPDVWVADLERRVAAAAGVTGFAGDRPLGPVDRPAVDSAVRAFADQVCRDLAPAWAEPIRTAATAGLRETDDRLDAELSALRFPSGDPGRATALGRLRTGLVVLAGAAVAFAGVSAWRGASMTPSVVALGVAVLLAVSVAVGARGAAARTAAEHARAVEDDCLRVIARVMRAHVLAPVGAELATYARFHRGVVAATSGDFPAVVGSTGRRPGTSRA